MYPSRPGSDVRWQIYAGALALFAAAIALMLDYWFGLLGLAEAMGPRTNLILAGISTALGALFWWIGGLFKG